MYSKVTHIETSQPHAVHRLLPRRVKADKVPDIIYNRDLIQARKVYSRTLCTLKQHINTLKEENNKLKTKNLNLEVPKRSDF